MKKLKLNQGLQINKEAISKLQDAQINSIKGGAAAAGSCAWTTCKSLVDPPSKTITTS
ncbi:class I lanthipeptide [Chryseobacterium paridis]|uniref:Class I lanthipeptide n=1 Tax=Chryseobacterium paridis TaxID=2800328 RepID=A0ABS1FYK2_9FLAO|nr:class I lanthipeptide [Chryseobacterium paridis]MBK1897533.1 class I lanthipeptide [Chryseobacterium paridis]